jgi:plastocyanin
MAYRGKLAAGMAVAAVVLAGIVMGACGDDSSDASEVPPEVPFEKVAKTPDANNVLTVVGLNLEFDTDELYAPAGEITVVLDNRDGGMPHNIHFYEGTNARGKSIAETPLNNGPVEDPLELDLEPGEYYYQCDVHPNMKGILTVE